MPNDTPLGILHFVTHAGAVGLALLVTLLLMSVVSWTVITGRVRRAGQLRKGNRQFRHAFDGVRDLAEARHTSRQHAVKASMARIADVALAATEWPPRADDAAMHGVTTGVLVAGLERAVQQQLDEEVACLETGQTALAAIASSAPFVGLLGTVWGIYHALIEIGRTGQSSLDQVAGPVGESLIMTACGLAVAIPASLAYNVFQRQLRLQIAELDKFAGRLLLNLPALCGG